MKRISIRSFAVFILLASAFTVCFAQASTMTEKGKHKTHTKLDKNKVPKVVTESFFKDYPVVTYGDWYGYPYFDNATGWYEYDPYYYSNDNPESYVVEFTHKDTTNRVIYDKNGKRIATHSTMRTELPKAVSNALNDGMYKSWKVGKDKEEIFKDGYSDKMKVYRVNVLSGKKKHTLYFQQDGTMLKDKTITS